MIANRASAGSFALAVLCVIGIVVITSTGHQVPAVLTDLAFGSAGVFLGVLFPNAQSVPTATVAAPMPLTATSTGTGLLAELVAEQKPPAKAHAP